MLYFVFSYYTKCFVWSERPLVCPEGMKLMKCCVQWIQNEGWLNLKLSVKQKKMFVSALFGIIFPFFIIHIRVRTSNQTKSVFFSLINMRIDQKYGKNQLFFASSICKCNQNLVFCCNLTIFLMRTPLQVLPL